MAGDSLFHYRSKFVCCLFPVLHPSLRMGCETSGDCLAAAAPVCCGCLSRIKNTSHRHPLNAPICLKKTAIYRRDKTGSGLNHMRRPESCGLEQLINLLAGPGDSGQESAVCAPVDLSFIVNSSLMAFEPLAFDMGKHITYDIEAALHVNGDDKKLRQLTDILLDNAANTVRITGSICVTLKDQRKEALLTVISDEGHERRNHLFLRFYRGTLPQQYPRLRPRTFHLPKALYLSMEED